MRDTKSIYTQVIRLPSPIDCISAASDSLPASLTTSCCLSFPLNLPDYITLSPTAP